MCLPISRNLQVQTNQNKDLKDEPRLAWPAHATECREQNWTNFTVSQLYVKYKGKASGGFTVM